VVGRGFLFNSGERTGDFAFRVDTADHRLHDVDRPRRAALLESTRSVRRKPVRTGPGPEKRSAEDTAARPVLRNRRVDRAHGVRLRSKAPSLRDSVSEIGGGLHLAGKPEAVPHLEYGASRRKTSSQMRAPDRAGAGRIPTGNRSRPDRDEAPTGVAGRFRSTDRRPCARRNHVIRGPGAGSGSAPALDGRILLREGVAGGGPKRSPEKLTGSRSGRLLGASSRRVVMHTRPLATPDRRRSGLRRAAGLCTLAPLHGRRTAEPLNNSVARDIAARDTMARH